MTIEQLLGLVREMVRVTDVRAATVEELASFPSWWSELVEADPRDGAQRAAQAWSDEYPDHLVEVRRVLGDTGLAAVTRIESEAYSGPAIVYLLPKQGVDALAEDVDGELLIGYPPSSGDPVVEKLPTSVRAFYGSLHNGLNVRFVEPNGAGVHPSSHLVDWLTYSGVEKRVSEEAPHVPANSDLVLICSDPNGVHIFAETGDQRDERYAYDISGGDVDWHPKQLPGCPETMTPMELIEDYILQLLYYDTELIL